MAVCRSVGSTISSLTMASPTIPSDGVSGKSIMQFYGSTGSIELIGHSNEVPFKERIPELVYFRRQGGRQLRLNLIERRRHRCWRFVLQEMLRNNTT